MRIQRLEDVLPTALLAFATKCPQLDRKNSGKDSLGASSARRLHECLWNRKQLKNSLVVIPANAGIQVF